ncbi:MAG TPA: alpha/beta fold hydrolase [Salinimicrobium sp.]|nr:alpha/beta fold hydrolase [Salinimicrobium sp.]
MKLHSTILGEGKPFLILHGFLGTGDNWKTLGNKFSDQGFEVHLLDQRNHGRSPHSDKFNFEVLSEDIKEYCNTHDLKDIILLGHSLGGKTAMFTTAKYPELIKKLIVVDIAPKYYAPHHQKILEGLMALEKQRLTSRDESEEILKKYVSDAGTLQFLLKNLYWKNKEELALRLNTKVLAQSGESIGEAFSSNQHIKNPSLFLRGTNSDYITEDDKETIKNTFPNSEIIDIQGVGHWLHAEKPQEVYTHILEFIS